MHPIFQKSSVGAVRACDHCSDFSGRHISLCNSLLRQKYEYGFFCARYFTVPKRNINCCFYNTLKFFKDIRDEIPLPVMTGHTQFVIVRSLSRNSSFDCMSFLCERRWKLVNRLGLNITCESYIEVSHLSHLTLVHFYQFYIFSPPLPTRFCGLSTVKRTNHFAIFFFLLMYLICNTSTSVEVHENEADLTDLTHHVFRLRIQGACCFIQQ